MSGTNEQKAEFFSTSLIELISNSNNKNPSDIIAAGTSTLSDMNLDGIVGEGANPEEGLAEETPQCFNQMKKTFGGLFKCLSGLAMGECCEGVKMACLSSSLFLLTLLLTKLFLTDFDKTRQLLSS